MKQLEELLWIVCSGGLLCFLILFFYLIVQPHQHDKKIKRRRTPKETILNLFDTVDPVDPEKIQEFRNH